MSRCSLSTLKRRFYALKDEIGIETWPQFFKDIRHLKCFSQIYPMSLSFITHPEMREEKEILDHEWEMIQHAFFASNSSPSSCISQTYSTIESQNIPKKKVFHEHKFVMSSYVNQTLSPTNTKFTSSPCLNHR